MRCVYEKRACEKVRECVYMYVRKCVFAGACTQNQAKTLVGKLTEANYAGDLVYEGVCGVYMRRERVKRCVSMCMYVCT